MLKHKPLSQLLHDHLKTLCGLVLFTLHDQSPSLHDWSLTLDDQSYLLHVFLVTNANGCVWILNMFEIQMRPFVILIITFSLCSVMCTRKTGAQLHKYVQLWINVFCDHETVANDLATLYDLCTIVIIVPSHTSKYFQAKLTIKEEWWHQYPLALIRCCLCKSNCRTSKKKHHWSFWHYFFDNEKGIIDNEDVGWLALNRETHIIWPVSYSVNGDEQRMSGRLYKLHEDTAIHVLWIVAVR